MIDRNGGSFLAFHSLPPSPLKEQQTKPQTSKSDGSGSPVPGYQGPSCPRDHCPDVSPTCYKVRNLGDIASPPGQPQGEEITVQIIDVCPGGHAQNYCKPSSIDARTRCQSYGTNELDIDEPAYVKLTGKEFADVSFLLL